MQSEIMRMWQQSTESPILDEVELTDEALAVVVGGQGDDVIGPGYDGSQGVDSEDISGVPDIDYSGFQYFPDQNSYGPVSNDVT